MGRRQLFWDLKQSDQSEVIGIRDIALELHSIHCGSDHLSSMCWSIIPEVGIYYIPRIIPIGDRLSLLSSHFVHRFPSDPSYTFGWDNCPQFYSPPFQCILYLKVNSEIFLCIFPTLSMSDRSPMSTFCFSNPFYSHIADHFYLSIWSYLIQFRLLLINVQSSKPLLSTQK